MVVLGYRGCARFCSSAWFSWLVIPGGCVIPGAGACYRLHGCFPVLVVGAFRRGSMLAVFVLVIAGAGLFPVMVGAVCWARVVWCWWLAVLSRWGGCVSLRFYVRAWVVFIRRAVWLSKRFYSCGCVLVGVKRSGGVCIYAGQSVFGCWVVVVFVVGFVFVLVRAFLGGCFWWVLCGCLLQKRFW